MLLWEELGSNAGSQEPALFSAFISPSLSPNTSLRNKTSDSAGGSRGPTLA